MLFYIFAISNFLKEVSHWQWIEKLKRKGMKELL